MNNLFRKFYFQIIVLLCALGVALNYPSSERMSDRLQTVIPIIGLTCSLEFKEAGAYFGRYFSGLATVHVFKNIKPYQSVNVRPNGGGHGFPSGHTYSATFGASYIVRKCAKRIPYLGVIAAIGAAFTATTRVESGNHTSFQVLWGIILALIFDLAFRKEARSTQIRGKFTTAWTSLKNRLKVKNNK